MTEIEFSALSKQCLDRRTGDIEALRSEIKAWTEDRNGKRVKVQWRFTTRDARGGLRRDVIMLAVQQNHPELNKYLELPLSAV